MWITVACIAALPSVSALALDDFTSNLVTDLVCGHPNDGVLIDAREPKRD